MKLKNIFLLGAAVAGGNWLRNPANRDRVAKKFGDLKDRLPDRLTGRDAQESGKSASGFDAVDRTAGAYSKSGTTSTPGGRNGLY